MNKYLISPCEDDDRFDNLFLIKAKNQEEALKKFADFYALTAEYFIEDLHQKSINMCFAEKFWLENENEVNNFTDNGEVLIDNDICKKRIRNYFKDEPTFGELFINYYFAKFEEVENYRFPDEMIKFIWLKEIDYRDLKIIDLSTIQVV